MSPGCLLVGDTTDIHETSETTWLERHGLEPHRPSVIKSKFLFHFVFSTMSSTISANLGRNLNGLIILYSNAEFTSLFVS